MSTTQPNKALRRKVQAVLLDRSTPNTHIARRYGLAISPIRRLRTGEATLDNLSLASAEKIGQDQTLRRKAEAVLNSRHIPNTHISRESGVALSPIQRLRKGEAKLDRLTLSSAEKLADYHDRFQQLIQREPVR